MSKVKTLADFKRLPIGTTLVLRSASEGFNGKPHKYLGQKRKIEHVQSNAIRFEGGSWLEYPKASEFETDGNLIIIKSDWGTVLAYEIID